MQAVILAGGLGSRLGPLTKGVPKPMVAVAGKPYLEHQLQLLRNLSITDIVLLTGYLGEQIEDYFGDGSRMGLRIRYSREARPIGTGGALRLAASLLRNTFLLIYGDSYLPIDYGDVLRSLELSDAEGLMVVFDNRTAASPVISNVEISSSGRVLRYEKDSAANLHYVEAGVLAFRRAMLSRIPEGIVSLEKQIFPQLISENAMLASVTNQPFYDIGTPERLGIIEEYLGGSGRLNFGGKRAHDVLAIAVKVST